MTDARPATATRPFRFGVVAPITTDLSTWRDRVRGIADSGYSTLLVPDVPRWQPAPGPTLAVAATLADLRVGTWVYASPLRPAWITAWEAHSLSVLTDGRFEMGIGTGRPGIEEELRLLGLPVVAPSDRLAHVRETVAALRELDGSDLHTPVVMAVRGPRAQALAAELADAVTFALVPGEARADVARLARDFRARRDLEMVLHVPVIGDAVAPFMAPPDTDPAPCAPPTRWRSCPMTRRRPPRRSTGDGRRSASPPSSSVPTSPTRSHRSSPNWPGADPTRWWARTSRTRPPLLPWVGAATRLPDAKETAPWQRPTTWRSASRPDGSGQRSRVDVIAAAPAAMSSATPGAASSGSRSVTQVTVHPSVVVAALARSAGRSGPARTT
nr:LLM class flavin-dependent oxidoreductase [Iamia sp. SCSIO 61187]